VQAVREALKLVERSSDSLAASESSDQAGRVDYVKVTSWGSGNADDLGNLSVAAHAQRAADGAGFYEVLARHMEVLQSGGGLQVARAPNARPVPPFSRWAFTEAHYVQYLIDLQTVYEAMEEAHKMALETLTAAPHLALGTAARCVTALKLLLPVTVGLQRSHSLGKDLATLAVTRDNSMTASRDVEMPKEPSPNAAAIAAGLRQAAVQCSRIESADEACRLAAKIFAASYVYTLTLLTSGNRVGASAAEKLGLFARQAVHTYRTYPEKTLQPLPAFRSALDAAGEELGEEGRALVVDEVGPAMRKASTLLEALARE
jgi:hypothetical protein